MRSLGEIVEMNKRAEMKELAAKGTSEARLAELRQEWYKEGYNDGWTAGYNQGISSRVV